MSEEKIKIILVDDDSSIRNMLSIVLKNEGYQVFAAEDGSAFLKKIKKDNFDLIISDIKMPDINGIDLLKKVKSLKPTIPVIMITAYASTGDAVEAMKYGAEDYIIKPFNLEELKIIIKKSLYKKSIEQENIDLKLKLEETKKFENIIGKNPLMLKIFDLVDTVSSTNSTVLITGESGTGKELIARAIHNKSERAVAKFVSVNCGAMPENLLESELFGHQKGAFTDAYKDKMGLFEIASKGTLFLDEIGEMPHSMQVKLLRALQEKKIRRVGSNEEIDIDVRIISATNKDLSKSIKENEFRSDLFYRLNVISINVPPLRERRDDIRLLMYYFMDIYNKKIRKNIRDFAPEVIKTLEGYSWQGNVRELENCIERAITLEKSDVIKLDSIPEELIYYIPESSQLRMTEDIRRLLEDKDFDFNLYLESISKQIISTALKMNNYRLNETTKMLNLNYRSLRYYIEKFELKKKE